MGMRQEIEPPSQSRSVGWQICRTRSAPSDLQATRLVSELITSAQGAVAGVWGGGAGLASAYQPLGQILNSIGKGMTRSFRILRS